MDIETKKRQILEELTQLTSLKRREVCEHNLELFVDTYLKHLSYKKRPQFHSDIIETISDESVTRSLFIAPRGFAKSTLCSRFFPLWMAVYGKKQDIFLISATIPLAKENLRIIRNELEGNEKLIEDFGELQSDKWTEEHLVLTNNVIIRAKGQGFQIRGFRPDMIICDDLESDSVIYSKEQRDKLENWFFRTLLPTLKPDQNLIYIGTKLHQFALISKLQKKPEFKSNLYRALVNGKSIWEDMWPTAELLKRRKDFGEYAFQAEYQNNPLSLTEQPIKPHFIEGVKAEGKKVLRCMSIDPAISEKESADFRAIQIMDKTEDGKFKEVLTITGRWGIDEQVEKVLDNYIIYKPDRVLLEEVAFQKVMRKLIIDKSRERNIYIPITRAELGVGDNKRPKDKMTRLLQVIHLFEQKLVQIDNEETKQELLSFPFGDYDDRVDVTVFNLQWLCNWQSGKSMVKRREDKILHGKDSFYVKEVRPGVYMAKIGEPPFKEVKSNFHNFDK